MTNCFLLHPFASRKRPELESAILKFHPPAEKGNVAYRGFYQMLLLEALPNQRMSSEAKLQLERLLRKFPKMNFSPPQSTEVITVGSPIAKEAAKKMTDKHWISAMRKYSSGRLRTPENWAKGGGHELASLLRTEAQSHKPRFAKMALQLSADIPAYYFEAILDGIAETFGELPKETKAEANMPQPLETDAIVAVLRRLHNLPNHPCGRAICSAIYRLADRELPDEVYEILTYYAVNDPNPREETWMMRTAEGQPYYGGNPHSAGINSVRGGAASAIPALSLPAPTSPVETTLSDEEIDERIQVAKAEAARIAGLTNCSHESRKSIFERVFHRECQQRGLKVSKVIWKSSGAAL